MTSALRSCDCLVAGGGPAGAHLAGLLALWGHEVLLVHRPSFGEAIPEETLVPGAGEHLVRAGVMPFVHANDQLGTPRHGVIWREPGLRWREAGAAARGYKVQRAAFDRELRRLAVERGARLLEGSVSSASGRDPWLVSLSLEDGTAATIEARVVAAATGKAGGEGWPEQREVARMAPTVALSVVLDEAGAREDATVIEAVPEGWWWWLPLADGRTCLTLFADTEELKQTGRDALWDAATRHATGPAAGTDARPARGVEATPRLRESEAGILLVGDAASTIDPLSSQGLEKALSSAREAAYVAATLLEAPGLEPALLAHQRSWERGLFRAHLRRTRQFYAQERRFEALPFWRNRSATAEERPALPDRLRPHAGLARATVFRRRARRLVEAHGFRVGLDGEAHDRIGEVMIADLLDVVGEAGGDPLDAASRHPRLFRFSRGLVAEALAELHRLGMIVAAE